MSFHPEADHRCRAMLCIAFDAQDDKTSDDECIVEIIRALARAAAQRDHRKAAKAANTMTSPEKVRR